MSKTFNHGGKTYPLFSGIVQGNQILVPCECGKVHTHGWHSEQNPEGKPEHRVAHCSLLQDTGYYIQPSTITREQLDAVEQEIHAGFTNMLLDEHIPLDIVLCDTVANTERILVPAGKRIGKRAIKVMVKYRRQLEIDPSPIRNRIRIIIEQAEARINL